MKDKKRGPDAGPLTHSLRPFPLLQLARSLFPLPTSLFYLARNLPIL
jgi:hypothetical protein